MATDDDKVLNLLYQHLDLLFEKLEPQNIPIRETKSKTRGSVLEE